MILQRENPLAGPVGLHHISTIEAREERTKINRQYLSIKFNDQKRFYYYFMQSIIQYKRRFS
jgi:hypothetical protein